jgi:hypothetical protein
LTAVYIKTDVKEVVCEDVDCIDLAGIAGFCEDGNRPLGYINDREFLGELSYC